ncbi:hypothetical protein SDC9_183265 [bioreactor metagenome]|uniref:Uncharacterized protein n=1 Tax=bioreactor metagenome TaxID=1076179 RepID=A0A645HB76_9ZZZZ
MSDLCRLANASVDGLARQVIQPLVDGWTAQMTAIHSAAQHGGIYGAGEHSIDANIVFGKFNGHGACERQNTALAGRISGDGSRSLNGMDRRNVDNGAVIRFDQHGVRIAGAHKGGTQIGGNGQIPFFHRGFHNGLGDLYGSVIDHRIQHRAEFGGFGVDLGDLLRFGDIPLNEQTIRREAFTKWAAVHANDAPAFF